MKHSFSIAWMGLFFMYASSTPLNLTAQQLSPLHVADAFIPSGYMGDGGAMSTSHADPSRADSLSIKVIYSPGASGWGGIYWQYPENNWCKGKGLDLRGYKKLVFYVRGETGKEVVKFKVGHDCGDSYAQNPPLTKRLSTSWQKVTINLEGNNLSNISGAFAWIVDAQAVAGQAITFYLDDIQFQ